jgi:rod shape-determining protein MreD
MKYLIWIFIIILVFIIQGSVSFYYVTPNLTVVLAYYAGVKLREVKGLFLGGFIGIMEDSLAGILLGPNLLSKGLIGYFASFIYKRFFRWTPVLGILSVFVFTIADGLIVYITRSIFAKSPVDLSTALLVISLQAMLNAPFGLFIKPRNGRQDSDI